MQDKEPLNKRIEDLPFSEGLKARLQADEIFTLQDLINMPVYEWHKQIEGFNYHDQHEVISYLIAQNLTDLLIED